MIVGDSPQGLMSRLGEQQAESYFAGRQVHGFNTAGWIDVSFTGRDLPQGVTAAAADERNPWQNIYQNSSTSKQIQLGDIYPIPLSVGTTLFVKGAGPEIEPSARRHHWVP